MSNRITLPAVSVVPGYSEVRVTFPEVGVTLMVPPDDAGMPNDR